MFYGRIVVPFILVALAACGDAGDLGDAELPAVDDPYERPDDAQAPVDVVLEDPDAMSDDGGAVDAMAVPAGDAAVPTKVPAGSDAGASPDAGGSSTGGPPMPTGLRGDYFPYFQARALTRIDPRLDFDWGLARPAPAVGPNFFSARWTGAIDARYGETYTFETVADQGVRLWIDARRVIDGWDPRDAHRQRGTIALTAGSHRITLEFYELESNASVHLYWSSRHQAREIVPRARLRPAAAASAPAAPRPYYTNPVSDRSCADPGVMRVEGNPLDEYFAVCTGGSFGIRHSYDLVHWTSTGRSILPSSGRAPWAGNNDRNWAPEIHQIGDRFVAYFTEADRHNRLAIGTATAARAEGPWTLQGAPLVHDDSPGVIDATVFRDPANDRLYLYWKLDGNQVGRPTPIYVRELQRDGLAFAAGSARTQVLVNDRKWEGPTVEAPALARHGGYYYLFYSGNAFDERYRTGVARSRSPRGPFQKFGPPILGNDRQFVGPGHGSIVRVRGEDYFVYHAWYSNGRGGIHEARGRQLMVDRINWRADGWPRINDGTPSNGLRVVP